jgi:hypothetical protein
MWAKISAALMIITSEFFSFNVWEWFLHSSVLERTKSDLLKINWFRGVILLNPMVLVPWGKFPLCHTPIRPISAFRDQISILIVGCVITRFASIPFHPLLLFFSHMICYQSPLLLGVETKGSLLVFFWLYTFDRTPN